MRRRACSAGAAGRKVLGLACLLVGLALGAAPAHAAGIVVHASAAVNSVGADYVLQNDSGSDFAVTYVDVFAPAGTNFTSVTGSQGSCTSSGAHITCTGVSVPPGMQMTIHGAASGLKAGDSHQLCGSNGSNSNCTTVAATAESEPTSCPAGQTGTPPNCEPSGGSGGASGASGCDCSRITAAISRFVHTPQADQLTLKWILHCASGSGSGCNALIEMDAPNKGLSGAEHPHFHFVHRRGSLATVSRTVATAMCSGPCGQTVTGQTQKITYVADELPLPARYTVEGVIRLICLHADGSEGQVTTLRFKYIAVSAILIEKFPGGRTVVLHPRHPGTQQKKKKKKKKKLETKCRCTKVNVSIDPTLLNRRALRPDKHDFGVGFKWTMLCGPVSNNIAAKIKGGCSATVTFLPPEVLAGAVPNPPQNFRLNLQRVTFVCANVKCTGKSGRFEIKMKSRDQLNKLFGRTLAFRIRTRCFGVVRTLAVRVFVDSNGVLRRPPPS